MRMMAILLLLAWLGTGVITFAICCLIIFPPSRFTRAVLVSLFGATMVVALLAVTALPLGGMEVLYRYLAHRVLASVGELRTGVRPVERLAGAIAAAPAEADTASGVAEAVGALPSDHPKGSGSGSLEHASGAVQSSSGRSPVNTEASRPRALPTGEYGPQGGRALVPAGLRNDAVKREGLQPSHHRRSRARVDTVDQVVRNERPEHVEKADHADTTDALGKIDVSAALVSDIIEQRDKRPEKAQRGDDLDRADTGGQTHKGDRADKAGKPEKADNIERADKSEPADKAEKVEKVENLEKADKVEKIEKADKPERAEKAEKVEKVEKLEKADKPERAEKVEKVEKVEKMEKADRPERGEKIEKVEKFEKVDRVSRVDRVEKVTRVERPERVRPERIDRPVRPERIERPERRGK